MRPRPRRLWHGGAVAALILALAACSYPERNEEADSLSQREGYRWSALEANALEDTLVVVTASGGGTRATALTLSALQGLHAAKLPGGTSLAEEVDVISSVSGGSVAAAHFALEGVDGFDALESDFIRRDGMSTMLWRGLNPVGLARLATPARERIDLLIDYLDERLFHGRTYADLVARGERPYLILNAGDMAAGAPFPFTQPYFSLLCSDLRRTKLSAAVAASAGFPVALSPVTLRNYSPCPAQDRGRWPPTWIENAARESDWYDNAARVRRGRVARAYALGTSVEGDAAKAYVHLLDGGIADNLGVSEPIRLLTTNDVSPQFLQRIAQGEIRRIVLVVVNARSAPLSELNGRRATPGMVAMLNGTIATAIDNATFANLDRVRTLLTDRLRAAGAELPGELGARFEAIAEETYLVPVDFAAIPDRDCRQAFQSVATSWTLAERHVDAVLAAGQALVRAAPDFRALEEVLDVEMAAARPGLDSACETIAAAQDAGG